MVKAKASGEMLNTIAVLPFVNMSPETHDYFSDGITEEIINALAKIKGLKVTSRTSAFAFKGKNDSIKVIGRALGVDIILEGSVRLSGNTARITAQLIEVASDFHFWSETFDRNLEHVFEVQDEISQLIADKIREHIGHFEIEDRPLVEEFDISLDTYKRYLEGRYHIMKLTRLETEKGIEILKTVIEQAPHFPLPYLSINQSYAYMGTMGIVPADQAFINAQPYLEKAIALRPDLPETLLNLSWISAWQEWNLTQAYAYLKQAVDIRPSDSLYLTFANLLAIEGRFEASFTYIDKAIALDPFSAINTHFKGFIYYLKEDFSKALTYFEHSLSLNPNLPFPPIYIGLSYLFMNQAEKALDYFNRLEDKVIGDLTKLGGTGLVYARQKDIVQVNTILQALESELKTDISGSASNYIILINALLGNTDTAIQLIQSAVDNRQPNVLLLKTEPVLKDLRSHTEFKSIMTKVFQQSTIAPLPQTKYKKALLNTNQVKTYSEKLERLMDNTQPYLDPGLTLRSLACQLSLPPNHLSQLLNEGFNQNFSEFVNTYRVKQFKLMVADPKFKHLTLLALAYESGFNSKTVFNTFFKKITGTTPKAFWKANQA